MDKIKIPIKECEHIKEHSYYNHNYYVLPKKHKFRGYDCILELYSELDDSYMYVFGYKNNIPFAKDDDNTCFVEADAIELALTYFNFLLDYVDVDVY